MFDKVLVANRGEIAVRIIRTCRKMGIRSVAVYSDADFRSLHAAQADEAVHLGGARASESYLAKEKIIEAALQRGCQAVHPGYGFLSENAEFAAMVEKAGLTFIGPPARVIALLGDKIASKKIALSAGVPTVPGGLEPVSSSDAAFMVAERIGFPVLLKPVAGGGGKGMRMAEDPKALASLFERCREEALNAFGDGRLFVERYIVKPRHIEIQVMADQFGNIIHLGERECSIQRRYQKLIEESPSMALTGPIREKIGGMACEVARMAGYANAGTVEFILDQDKEIYFLEMNTRLQVEHPVTEMVASLDLVELQIRAAAGEGLPLSQEEVRRSGWAIEARICAEDPSRDFAPSVGLITRYAAPQGDHVRVDSGIAAGSHVHVYYDPMVAKVIAWGEDREWARKRLVQALNGYHIEGVTTNVDFINQILMHPAFIRGELSTGFIRDYMESEENRVPPPVEHLHFMAIAVALVYHLRETLVKDSLLLLRPRLGSASLARRKYEYFVKSDEDIFNLRLRRGASEFEWLAGVEGNEYRVEAPAMEYYRRRLKLVIDETVHHFRLRYGGNFIWAAFCGIAKTFEIYSPREWELARYMPPPVRKGSDDTVNCPMPGLIVGVKVKPGDRVYRGQELVIVESMKMETSVASPVDGEVTSVMVKTGDEVETGAVLLSFKTPPPESDNRA